MTRLQAASFEDALQAFEFFTAWWGGWVPVRLGSWRGRDEFMWRQGPHSDLPDVVRWLDEEHDDEVLLGMPQNRPGAGGVAVCSVLWCRVEGTDQLQRARRFRPLPSLVLAEGSSSRRLLMWPLERAIPHADVVERNRKIAYALRAKQKWGDPDLLWVPAPGTCLRDGRSRPVPVRVARLALDFFAADAVTGRLKEPPPRDAWLTGGAR